MSEFTDSVEAETLTALLRHFHWAPTSKEPGRYEIWTTQDNPSNEVIVPLDPTKGDFAGLVEQLPHC